HLVGVAGRGQSRAEVEELPDARVGQVAHGPGEEGAVGPGRGADGGVGGYGLLAGDPVGLEVVLSAEPVVVDPGRVGHPGVQAVQPARTRRRRHRHASSPPPRAPYIMTPTETPAAGFES